MFASNLLENKRILVTGGRSGIGYTIAESALKYGAKVFIASRNEEKLGQAAKELSKIGDCKAFACDIRQPEQLEALANFIAEEAGGLDALVNNAGGGNFLLLQRIFP